MCKVDLLCPLLLISCFVVQARIDKYREDLQQREKAEERIYTTRLHQQHRHAYNHTFSDSASVLRVLDLNTWGLSWPFSLDRGTRFRALREVIAHSDYDVVLLQEVWYRADHEVIRSALPHSTYFGIFNSGCSGYLLPLGCSGLTILSKHPFEQVEFIPFMMRGSFWSFDGEIFVQKGLGRARILFGPERVSVDLFTTHLVSYTSNPNRDNSHVRYLQALETVRHIDRSNAEVKIFAGDVNALPYRGKKQPYSVLTSLLTDSLVDKYANASWHPWFATFGNHHNTYTREDAPERIDYLMYWASEDIAMCTAKFTMPMYTAKNKAGVHVSLSDHEALQADFYIERRSTLFDNPPPLSDASLNVSHMSQYYNSHLVRKGPGATSQAHENNGLLFFFHENDLAANASRYSSANDDEFYEKVYR